MFMLAYDFDYFSPTLTSCLLYIQCLVNSFKNISSVKNYLSGARTVLTAAGGNPAPLLAPLVGTVIRGATRISTHITTPATPLPRTTLLKLCKGLVDLGPDGRVAMAAVLFGVSTFLRQCNFLPRGAGQCGPHMLRRRDIRRSGGALLVLVASTKTQAQCDGPITLMISPAPGSRYCPVKACLDAWAMVPGLPSSVLFLLPSTGQALTAPGLLAMMRWVLRALHHPAPGGVTLHSLRRTGALLASAGGSPDEEVMAHGTWTSSAYRAYVPRPVSSSVAASIAAVWD